MSEAETIEIPTELLEKDSVELSNDDVAINKIVEYLKSRPDFFWEKAFD